MYVCEYIHIYICIHIYIYTHFLETLSMRHSQLAMYPALYADFEPQAENDQIIQSEGKVWGKL